MSILIDFISLNMEGIIGSVVGGAILIFILWLWQNFLRFFNPKHFNKLKGEAVRIYSLQGKKTIEVPNFSAPLRPLSKTGNMMSMQSQEIDADLAENFPPPKPEDVQMYKLEKVTLSVNRKEKARLKGLMKYSNKDKNRDSINKIAEIEGIGDFIYSDKENFRGTVSLYCKMVEKDANKKIKSVWTVSCFLKGDAGRQEWSGFWLLFDREKPSILNFGEIKLEGDERPSISEILMKKIRSS